MIAASPRYALVCLAEEDRLRASIGDYEVLEVLAGPDRGVLRYRCRAPSRLGWDEPVEVAEVAVGEGGWPQWSDRIVRLAGAGSADLRQLLETGPDPAGSGAYVSYEAATGGTLAAPPTPSTGGPDRSAGCQAVAAAARAAHGLHQAGLAHGYINPAAICLTSHGPVLDLPPLGLPDGWATPPSRLAGLVTTDPDVLRGEAPSRTSDVWSLGATLHVILSDRPLYPGIAGDQPVTAVQRVLFTRPEIDPDLPGPTRDLVERCLTLDPTGRPATAAEVAEALAGGEDQ